MWMFPERGSLWLMFKKIRAMLEIINAEDTALALYKDNLVWVCEIQSEAWKYKV